MIENLFWVFYWGVMPLGGLALGAYGRLRGWPFERTMATAVFAVLPFVAIAAVLWVTP